MTANFYKSSRQRLLENLNEGSMVFLYSGIAPVKSSDDNMHPSGAAACISFTAAASRFLLSISWT